MVWQFLQERTAIWYTGELSIYDINTLFITLHLSPVIDRVNFRNYCVKKWKGEGMKLIYN